MDAACRVEFLREMTLRALHQSTTRKGGATMPRFAFGSVMVEWSVAQADTLSIVKLIVHGPPTPDLAWLGVAWHTVPKRLRAVIGQRMRRVLGQGPRRGVEDGTFAQCGSISPAPGDCMCIACSLGRPATC